MAFEMDDEKAVDVLIWWVESADGSINYREEKTVKKVLEDIDYSLDTFYQETVMHIGSLSNEHIRELIEEAIKYGSDHFDHHRKQVTIALLNAIAECPGAIDPSQEEKIERIRNAFGIGKLDMK